jgi:hypothetical protein
VRTHPIARITGKVLAHMEYLAKFPAEVPGGDVLVHNHVRPATPGFRYWLQSPDDARLTRCSCNYAGWVDIEHFRVNRETS